MPAQGRSPMAVFPHAQHLTITAWRDVWLAGENGDTQPQLNWKSLCPTCVRSQARRATGRGKPLKSESLSRRARPHIPHHVLQGRLCPPPPHLRIGLCFAQPYPCLGVASILKFGEGPRAPADPIVALCWVLSPPDPREVRHAPPRNLSRCQRGSCANASPRACAHTRANGRMHARMRPPYGRPRAT